MSELITARAALAAASNTEMLPVVWGTPTLQTLMFHLRGKSRAVVGAAQDALRTRVSLGY
jgi:hypothetical protein